MAKNHVSLFLFQAQEVFGSINALASGHELQAPFLVAVVDTNQQGKRVILKALIICKKGVVSQLDIPSVPQLLTFILGSYFVFEYTYPRAYNSFLRLLEKQLHGALSSATNQIRAKKEYITFMASYQGIFT